MGGNKEAEAIPLVKNREPLWLKKKTHEESIICIYDVQEAC